MYSNILHDLLHNDLHFRSNFSTNIFLNIINMSNLKIYQSSNSNTSLLPTYFKTWLCIALEVGPARIPRADWPVTSDL